ncbi:hypothetical protein MVI27_08195 [Chryseobacterium salipaludis]|uniref:hypothetical protein n=1 Tax=Chryseobacterium TaxID=59732 RepID=UPI000E99C9D3|nr:MULTISPECIES: hypothetical protein [Chryseobacterium]MCJ8498239.1 hypothetical protein [Chryseobacterium salipaludis]MCX3297513.1 hypothetical protein [Planobacterium sp. JC490]HAV02096.1 hypothetical protein [Chryseobacterium sp.]
MQRFYKIFLVLFIVFLGFNIYSIEWDLGFWHEENSKFILSTSAALVGILVLFIMHTMSKLQERKH